MTRIPEYLALMCLLKILYTLDIQFDLAKYESICMDYDRIHCISLAEDHCMNYRVYRTPMVLMTLMIYMTYIQDRVQLL